MKVTLEVEDTDSLTGGQPDVLFRLLQDAAMPLGITLGGLDPDHHIWVVFVERVEHPTKGEVRA